MEVCGRQPRRAAVGNRCEKGMWRTTVRDTQDRRLQGTAERNSCVRPPRRAAKGPTVTDSGHRQAWAGSRDPHLRQAAVGAGGGRQMLQGAVTDGCRGRTCEELSEKAWEMDMAVAYRCDR
jgi:hypothetical protein